MTQLNVGRRTVLILDRELAFAFWLGQALIQAGYDAFPAKSCEDATQMLTELNVGIDLLVVSFGLVGARDFTTALRRSQFQLKVLATVDEEEEPYAVFPEVDAVKNKPLYTLDDSTIEWVRTIESLLLRDADAGSAVSA